MPSEPALDAPGTAPRRLPPQALLAKVDPRSLLAVLFVVFSSGGLGAPLILVFLAGTVGLSAVVWARFSYGYDGDVLRVEQGVFQRQLRAIDVGRIQQVELDQPVVHRILGIARLRVETASEGGEAEVQLDGLLLADATALRDALRARSRGATVDADGAAPVEEPTHTLVEVSTRDIALGAVTGSRLVFFPVVIGFVMAQVVEFSEDATGAILSRALDFGLLLALLVPVFAVVVAVVSAVVQEGNFRIARRGDDLVVSRGLATRREAVVPTHRVQVVVVEQNVVRRLFGVSTVAIKSGGSGVGNEAARTLRIPLVRDAALPTIVRHLLPEVPADETLIPHPRPARRRAMIRWTLRLLAPLVAVAVSTALLLHPAWAVVVALAPTLGVVLGLAEYGVLAHGTSATVVAARDGALAVRRSYAARGRIQGVVRHANVFQRRLGLASATVHLVGAGGAITILDADRHDAARLATDLTATPT